MWAVCRGGSKFNSLNHFLGGFLVRPYRLGWTWWSSTSSQSIQITLSRCNIERKSWCTLSKYWRFLVAEVVVTAIVNVWQECSIRGTFWFVFQQAATLWSAPSGFDIENESNRAILQTGFAGRTNEVALARMQTREEFDLIVFRAFDGWQMAGVWCAVNIFWTIALADFRIEEKSVGALTFDTVSSEAHNVSANKELSFTFNSFIHSRRRRISKSITWYSSLQMAKTGSDLYCNGKYHTWPGQFGHKCRVRY